MTGRTIDIYLPSETMYVSGSVNGVDVTWTNMGNNTWQAMADKTVDGIYVLNLTLISATGVSAEIGMTLYDALHLITDRTDVDVTRWQQLKRKGYGKMTDAEKAEWAVSKGAYNHTDLNRVEAAVLMVASKLRELGIAVLPETKSDWTQADVPTKADMDRYLGNVTMLQSSSSGLHLAPELPSSMARLDYIGANNIEAALLFINAWADGMKNDQRYAGETFGGEW